MDSALLAKSLGAGLATGLSTLAFATLSTLPSSYIMNKFIYHGPVMRLMLGGAVGMFSIFSTIFIAVMVISGRWQKAHYFGLVPVIRMEENPIIPSGYMSFVFTILYAFIHPVTMFYIDREDVKGYVHSIDQMLVHKDAEVRAMPITIRGEQRTIDVTQGAVCEEFSKAAEFAGSIIDKAEWVRQMTMLESSGIGKFIFTPAARR